MLSKRTLAEIRASGDIARLHNALVSHITDQDQKAERRAMRTPRGHYNPYGLGLMLAAAGRALDEAHECAGADGAGSGGDSLECWIHAVLDHFTPTRTMHTFLKNFAPDLDVVHGHWTWKNRR